LSQKVHAASAEADKAEYRLDVLLAPESPDATAGREAPGNPATLPQKTPVGDAAPKTSDSTKSASATGKEDLTPRTKK